METGALRPGDPERLGSYDVIGRLGEGGQGAVFLGRGADGGQVAIKLLHAELTVDEKARARFLRELEVAKRVAPFCTAPVIDADVAGDRPYIVSEYVPGPSLARYLTEQGTLTGAALERLAIGTVTAMVSLHQAGIIHRDFKPHNVLIGPDGPRVIDFGVARAISGATTVTSRVIGTPAYMAPEQLQGEDLGTPVDVFCWAATMVFAATGNPPFGQDTIPAVINRILHHEPNLGELDDGPLRDLVVECLAKDPGARPQARQLLLRLLGHDATPAAAFPIVADEDDATGILAEATELAADINDDNATRVDSGAKPRRVRARVRAGKITRATKTNKTANTNKVAAVAVADATKTANLPGVFPVSAADTQAGKPGTGRRRPELSSPKILILAGAAAILFVAIVATVSFALSGGDKDGKPISDRRAPGPSTERAVDPSKDTKVPVVPVDPGESSDPPGGGTDGPSDPAEPTSPRPTDPSPSPSDPKPTDPSTPDPSPSKPDPDPSGSGKPTGDPTKNAVRPNIVSGA